jgi:hypothetical protein
MTSRPPTAILDTRCLHHVSREAVVRCPECRRFFCRECVTEHLGRMICAGCVGNLAPAGMRDQRSLSSMWIGFALAGLLLTWILFYYFGEALARIPDSFHGGPA